MNLGNRKILVLVTLCLVCTMSLFATQEIMITWEWEPADEQVSAFRYQVNGENPDKWTVVDASVTEYQYGPVADDESYILYVQQSYDGEQWSSSASLAYDPVEFGTQNTEEPTELAEEEKQVAEPLSTTPSEAEVAEIIVQDSEEQAFDESYFDDFVVAEEDPWEAEWDSTEEPWDAESFTAEEPALQEEEIRELNRRIDLYMGIGARFDNHLGTQFFDPNDEYTDVSTLILPSITIDYVNTGIRDFGSRSLLGYRIGLTYQGYQEDVSSSHLPSVDLHGLAVLEYPLSEQISLEVSAGLTFLFTSNAIHTHDYLGLFIGPVLQVQGKYHLTDTWSIGLQAESRLLFGGQFKPYEFSGMIRLGAGYQF